jgi:UDPglucose 6-dehydrogenase
MRIAVIGTGYVGLVAAACLAETGNQVVGVDRDESKIKRLRRGSIPIYEPGLEEMVRRNHAEGRLTFTTGLDRAVRQSHIAFIAVGTPQGEDGSADLQHVLDVARDIGRAMKGYTVIVNKSTVPVGTSGRVRDVVRRETTHPFSVVSNPEFLKQGAAIDDFMRPDRVVIGADDPRAADIMVELYKPYTRTGAPIMVMDCASAELSKYAANAMLATRISFMNEIANVCDLFGADVDEVRRAIAADKRIGASFLFPGVGYGGSCFPKDVKAVIHFSAQKRYDFQILRAVEQVNESQKVRIVSALERELGSLKGRRIAVWGLAFKPRTDDMREAPSIPIVRSLLVRGARVQAYDPEAMEAARAHFGSRIDYAKNSYEALKGADALLVVTEWNEFREPDFARMKKLMRAPIVFDGRNIYTPQTMRAQGFRYHSIGRPAAAPVRVTESLKPAAGDGPRLVDTRPPSAVGRPRASRLKSRVVAIGARSGPADE